MNMTMVLALALRQKPATELLYDGEGNSYDRFHLDTYRMRAVVNALNWVRLAGQAQLFIRADENVVECIVQRLEAELTGMALSGEKFNVEMTSITAESHRVDVTLTHAEAPSA